MSLNCRNRRALRRAPNQQLIRLTRPIPTVSCCHLTILCPNQRASPRTCAVDAQERGHAEAPLPGTRTDAIVAPGNNRPYLISRLGCVPGHHTGHVGKQRPRARIAQRTCWRGSTSGDNQQRAVNAASIALPVRLSTWRAVRRFNVSRARGFCSHFAAKRFTTGGYRGLPAGR